MVAILYCFLNGEVSPSQTLVGQAITLWLAQGLEALMGYVQSKDGLNLAAPSVVLRPENRWGRTPRTLLKGLISAPTPLPRPADFACAF